MKALTLVGSLAAALILTACGESGTEARTDATANQDHAQRSENSTNSPADSSRDAAGTPAVDPVAGTTVNRPGDPAHGNTYGSDASGSAAGSDAVVTGTPQGGQLLERAGESLQNAGERAGEALSNAGERVAETTERGVDAAGRAGERAEQGLENAGNRAENATERGADAAGNTGERAGQGLENAGNRAENATERGLDAAGDAISDAAITASVNAELARDDELSAIGINVDTDSGRVTLSGTAPNQAAIQRATQLAKQVRGVKDVHNALRVEAR